MYYIMENKEKEIDLIELLRTVWAQKWKLGKWGVFGLVADGHTIDLLVLNASAMSMSAAFKSVGVNVIRGTYHHVYNPLNIAVIAWQLKKQRYDVVHAHLFPTQYFAAVAKMFSCSKDRKSVV